MGVIRLLFRFQIMFILYFFCFILLANGKTRGAEYGTNQFIYQMLSEFDSEMRPREHAAKIVAEKKPYFPAKSESDDDILNSMLNQIWPNLKKFGQNWRSRQDQKVKSLYTTVKNKKCIL